MGTRSISEIASDVKGAQKTPWFDCCILGYTVDDDVPMGKRYESRELSRTPQLCELCRKLAIAYLQGGSIPVGGYRAKSGYVQRAFVADMSLVTEYDYVVCSSICFDFFHFKF